MELDGNDDGRVVCGVVMELLSVEDNPMCEDAPDFAKASSFLFESAALELLFLAALIAFLSGPNAVSAWGDA